MDLNCHSSISGPHGWYNVSQPFLFIIVLILDCFFTFCFAGSSFRFRRYRIKMKVRFVDAKWTLIALFMFATSVSFAIYFWCRFSCFMANLLYAINQIWVLLIFLLGIYFLCTYLIERKMFDGTRILWIRIGLLKFLRLKGKNNTRWHRK